MKLDELIALNDEIAALVRAGVPLEMGLAELGGDLPGRLGQFVTVLAERTARGESLAAVLTEDAKELPPTYRAVVEAGVRAGRLPAALEAVAASARRLVETYRITATAAAYSLLVVLTAWCGLLFFACVLAPRLAEMFLAFGVPGQGFFAFLARAGDYARYWGPIVPVAIVLLAVWWFTRAEGRWVERLFGWTPWTRRMLRYSRTATFLEILALLVENQTPLPEAVVLAGEASGDPRTLRSARQMAATLESGQTRPVGPGPAFPPLVNWLLLAAGRDGALLPAVKHAAATYHRRARHQSDLLRIFLPILLTITVGGGVTALYALALFIPYTSMLRSLAG